MRERQREPNLNKAVMEMEPKQDSSNIGVGKNGITNNVADNGLGLRTCFIIETKFELTLRIRDPINQNVEDEGQNQCHKNLQLKVKIYVKKKLK